MLVADPEVPRRVAESLAVAAPVTVEEPIVTAVVRLGEYPAITAGRFLARI